MILHVQNETDTLKAVVLGQPQGMGKTPKVEDTFDAKSRESVLKGIYPSEEEVTQEMNAFEQVLKKHDVQVFRPWVLENCNQVFARDVAFVIDDKIIISNIIEDRVDEQEAYERIFNSISFNKIYNLPEKAHIEGGDVILCDETIYLGTYKKGDYSQFKTARTNTYGADYLRELFPKKNIIELNLVKDDNDPKRGILHLDCTFQPVGKNKAIVYKGGFVYEKEYQAIIDTFGIENVFEVTQEEMYFMTPNVFSISPEVVVVEENFDRLANWLEYHHIQAERIPYHEVSKMGGLLRCSTMPLIRE